jgi:hypothetical protein
MSSKQVCICPHPQTLTFNVPWSKPTTKPGWDPPSAYSLQILEGSRAESRSTPSWVTPICIESLTSKNPHTHTQQPIHTHTHTMIYSVDGMADKHAQAAEKQIAGLLAAKWTRQYSQMACFIGTRMCLAIVRSNTLLLRGDLAMNWHRHAPDDGVGARAAMTFQIQ